jgi:GrpB-like predicted nucleotidyltransferase (UPF0157 family)
MNDAIHLEPYNPTWATKFSSEAELLRNRFGDDLQEIEHFGSTSVPGLSAKPIIDILLGLNSRARPLHIEVVKELGFTLRRHNTEFWSFFRKGTPRTHHLHVIDLSCSNGQSHWSEHLKFRDYLRQSKQARQEYEALKAFLAFKYKDDRRSYELGKTTFVRSIIEL